MNLTDFGYAIGRIRVLETRLLNQNEVERMLAASDAKEAYRILNELDYANHVGDIEKVENFQAVINAGLLDSKQILSEICPDPEVLLLLWLAYDIHNCKVLLKARLRQKALEDVQSILSDLGAIKIAKLVEVIFAEQLVAFGLGPDYDQLLYQHLGKARKVLTKEGGLQAADLIMDKAYFELAKAIVQQKQNSFLQEYLNHVIDLHNIGLILRIAVAGEGLGPFSAAFIEGASFARGVFEQLSQKSPAEIVEALKNTAYGEMLIKTREDLSQHASFLELERQMYNHRIHFIRRAKLIAFGPEPIVAYFWTKLNNAQIIRLIMIGKLNGIPAEKIRPHLHDLYA